ncbi:hypothetical protein B296_00008063 [Ensete ventricosum]|uniref:Uncharacterized protein n=1 Tax=Ensete ventricosum TaxID=4639 RepID=A0A426YFW1_ENSVE|nr:hypothetical protein B296_00008063 [Ensete ventricosum]
MGANGAGSKRRKGEQGSGLIGGEEEATAGGHGEDSDGLPEEAVGASTFGVAVVVEDDSGREEGEGATGAMAEEGYGRLEAAVVVVKEERRW